MAYKKMNFYTIEEERAERLAKEEQKRKELAKRKEKDELQRDTKKRISTEQTNPSVH